MNLSRRMFGALSLVMMLLSDVADPSAPGTPDPSAKAGITLNITTEAVTPLSDPPITITKSFRMTITYDSVDTADACTNTNPAYQLATLTLVNSTGAQSEIGSIKVLDVYGGLNCQGHFNKSEVFTPISGKGTYTLVLVATTVSQLLGGGRHFILYPNVKIEADGAKILDLSFPSSGGLQDITKIFTVVFK